MKVNAPYRCLSLHRRGKKSILYFHIIVEGSFLPMRESEFLILHRLMLRLHNRNVLVIAVCVCLCVTIFKTQQMPYLALTRAGAGFCLSGCRWLGTIFSPSPNMIQVLTLEN